MTKQQKHNIFYLTFKSKIGKLFIATKDKLSVNFITTIDNNAYIDISNTYNLFRDENLPVLKHARLEIINYLKGEGYIPKVNIKLISSLTPFEIQVLTETKQIPYGKTITYKELAKSINSEHSSRAVGNALSKNPIPIIIPCHRIVRSTGEYGGFALGRNIKHFLINLEKEATLE